MSNSTSIGLSPQSSALLGKIAKSMGLGKAGCLDAMLDAYAEKLGIVDDLCRFTYQTGNIGGKDPHDRYLFCEILEEERAFRNKFTGYAFSIALTEIGARVVVAALRQALDRKNEGAEVAVRGGIVTFCRRGHSLEIQVCDEVRTTTAAVASRIADKLAGAAGRLAAMAERDLVPATAGGLI